ncbi:calcineurin subunit B-like protein [Tanacetum coccineum]
MGNTSSMLTQYDIEEVQEHCNNTFSQQEIVSLYQRFCQLDRNSGGFISADEFLSVPEFAVNPLSQRLFRMIDGLNFKEFVAFLSAFSSRATLQHKVEFIFKVYDSDGNGKVAFSDLLDVLRDLTGQFISEQQREASVITRQNNGSTCLFWLEIEVSAVACPDASSGGSWVQERFAVSYVRLHEDSWQHRLEDGGPLAACIL